MDISSRIAVITITIFAISLPYTAGASEISGDRIGNGSQVSVELQQWDPSPEDSGQCNGKKCATGGSY